MAKAKLMLVEKEVDFETLINENKIVLVDFYADWCGPCKMMAPLLQEVAKNYEDDIIMAKVDVELYDQLASEYQISSIPTILVFIDGKPKHNFVGFTPKSKIEAFLDITI